jgi:hypothetical protein
MTEGRRRRWFQLSLRSLFLLTLVVAAFFAGYSLAMRRAEEAARAEREARESAEQSARQAEAELERLRMAELIDAALRKMWSDSGEVVPVDSNSAGR